MNRARLAILLALFAAFGCQPEVEWLPLEPAGSHFRAEMPGVPQVVRRQVKLPFGDVPVNMWLVEDGDRAFIVGYTEYPEKVGEVATPDELLDSARDGHLQNIAGRLVRDEPTERDGHRGRVIEIEAASGAALVRGELFIAHSRLYQVLATTTPEEREGPLAARFLDSFELLPASP
ncbi:MAG: hypothetical protein OEP95_00280 [Myxococcales bacterium]|nr:hypothetical protein [Myxococcales bacterium]